MKKEEKMELGITLVALVVTIVVLLILAGITLTYVLGDNSVFSQAKKAKEQTAIAKAREKLEVVLEEAKIYKHTELSYNQDEYLDEMIVNKIPSSKINGDIAIVDKYAFTLDRSIPWIGEYVGKEEDLVFPKVKISEVEYLEDYKSAKFTITAKEATNGISKIEIIQHGQVIEIFEYENSKEEITKEYTVQQNGIYTVKVYSKLTGNAKVEVEGLVMAVEFSPNGNEEYKKEHSVKVTVKEDMDKVKSLKYQWSKEVTAPEGSTFVQSCNNNDTVIEEDVTGTYYLWVLLETEKGKKNICRSEGFNFDNEGPTITNVIAEKYSGDGVTITATAQDTKSGTVKFEFYVDEETRETEVVEKTTESVTKSVTIEGLTMGSHNFKVVVYDLEGNSSYKSATGETMKHAWLRYNTEISYKCVETLDTTNTHWQGNPSINNLTTKPSLESYFNSKTGKFSACGSSLTFYDNISDARAYLGKDTWRVSVNSSVARLSRSRLTQINASQTLWGEVRNTSWILTAEQQRTKTGTGTEVQATSIDTYPRNGLLGTYWYEYSGIK